MPLVMREIPFAIPPIRESVQWNIANSNDRALRWVTERLQAAAMREVPAPEGNVVTLNAVNEIDLDEIEAEYRMNHPQR